MKKIIIFHAVRMTVACLVIAGFPNRAESRLQDQAPSKCSLESKNHKDFLANLEGDSRDEVKALEAAKEYLACPVDPSDKEDVLAKLNLTVGRMLSLKNSYSEAIAYFVKAASYNTTVKTSPQTYAYLAEAYLEGPYAKLSAAYARGPGKDDSDEIRLAYANIIQIVDRAIDAYARALALTAIEPSKTAPANGLRITQVGSPNEWMGKLNDLYRFRHKGSDVGLKDLIGTILSEPLPPEPAPISSLSRQKER